MSGAQAVLVYGAGGHAKVVIDAIEQQGRYAVVGLLDDDPRLKEKRIYGYRVLGGYKAARGLRSDQLRHCIVAIGHNATRIELAARLAASGWSFATVVHPRAVIARGARIGAGSVVMAGGIVNADARIGRHVIVNTAASVDHDCRIASGVHLAPGCRLCGGVSVGAGSLIGAGCIVTPGVKIARWVRIRAGATVSGDLRRDAQSRDRNEQSSS